MAGFDALKDGVSKVETSQAAEGARVTAALGALGDEIAALKAQIAATPGISDPDAQALADRLSAVSSAADAIAPTPAPATP